MKDLIKTKIKEYDLNNDISVVAVSGGVDSVVLLDLLAKKLHADKIVVAHVDHGIRKNSAKDQLFVKKLAQSYKLVYETTKLRLSKKDEATARKERYKWLNKVAKKHSAKYIITAHHLDDQLETVLLNLTRGSGPIELWGMKELSGNVLRPLISVSKEDILKYAKISNLKYVEDKTNKDIGYARNRLRHKVIPELEKINPSIKKTVQKNTELAGELANFTEEAVSGFEKKARKGNTLVLRELVGASPFLVKTLIKKMLHEYTETETDVYSKNVAEVYSLLKCMGTKKTSFKRTNIIKDYDYLIFDPKEKEAQKEEVLELGTVAHFNGFNILASIKEGASSKNNILLPSSFSDNLKVRVWQKGDRISTETGRKKLQDIFIDAKISLADRQKWPVIFHEKEIIWVPRLQASKYAKKEKKNLIIEVK